MGLRQTQQQQEAHVENGAGQELVDGNRPQRAAGAGAGVSGDLLEQSVVGSRRSHPSAENSGAARAKNLGLRITSAGCGPVPH